MDTFTAEIIVIGDELLSGETVDTNSNYLDKQLEAAGWSVVRHTTVKDELEDISSAIITATKRARLVLCSGGLGPTRDDLTLEAFARALDCELRQDLNVLTDIQSKFEAIGRTMTPNNARQSFVPTIGEVIDNPVGTAPSFTANLNEADVYLLPGVPRELKWLFNEKILPKIDRGAADIHRRTLKVIGFGESRLEHTIQKILAEHQKRVVFGFRALGIENHIKLMAKGDDAKDAIQLAEKEIIEALDGRVFGADNDELVEVVGARLGERTETIATAESCTGGLISKLMTDIPGSSAYFVGGYVTYSNESKTRLLGVPTALLEEHGAVSVQVAEAMALGAQHRMNSSWAMASTGIAGPGGGTTQKPVGTVCMALAGPKSVQSFQRHILGDRLGVRRNTALVLFEMLRRKLFDLNEIE